MKTEAGNLLPHGSLIHRSVGTLSFGALIFVILRLVRALDDDRDVTGRVFVGHITSPEAMLDQHSRGEQDIFGRALPTVKT